MNFLGMVAEVRRKAIGDVEDPWKMLFEAGKDARIGAEPFDSERAEPWKRGWIAADIHLGVLEEQEQ